MFFPLYFAFCYDLSLHRLSHFHGCSVSLDPINCAHHPYLGRGQHYPTLCDMCTHVESSLLISLRHAAVSLQSHLKGLSHNFSISCLIMRCDTAHFGHRVNKRWVLSNRCVFKTISCFVPVNDSFIHHPLECECYFTVPSKMSNIDECIYTW